MHGSVAAGPRRGTGICCATRAQPRRPRAGAERTAHLYAALSCGRMAKRSCRRRLRSISSMLPAPAMVSGRHSHGLCERGCSSRHAGAARRYGEETRGLLRQGVTRRLVVVEAGFSNYLRPSSENLHLQVTEYWRRYLQLFFDVKCIGSNHQRSLHALVGRVVEKFWNPEFVKGREYSLIYFC